MEKAIILKKMTSVSGAQIWLFCNLYRKENGQQFRATTQRAKNMQYTTQESH